MLETTVTSSSRHLRTSGLTSQMFSSVRRVLKPPGGGTSDIFGGSEPAEKPVGRKKSVQTSSIVLNDNVQQNGGGPVENGHSKQGTCNERLFGPPLDANASNTVAAKMNGEVITNGNDHPGRHRIKFLLISLYHILRYSTQLRTC